MKKIILTTCLLVVLSFTAFLFLSPVIAGEISIDNILKPKVTKEITIEKVIPEVPAVPAIAEHTVTTKVTCNDRMELKSLELQSEINSYQKRIDKLQAKKDEMDSYISQCNKK